MVASQSEKEKYEQHSPPSGPRFFQPSDPKKLPAEVDLWVATEEGTFHLTLASFLHPVETPPPQGMRGKPLGRAQAPCSHCWSYCLFYRTPVRRAGALLVGLLGTWLSVSEVHPAPASWNLQRAWLPAFLACATIREKKKKNP